MSEKETEVTLKEAVKNEGHRGFPPVSYEERGKQLRTRKELESQRWCITKVHKILLGSLFLSMKERYFSSFMKNR